METKRLTAHVVSENCILTADVLQLGSELWLIAQWLETQDGRWQTPGRAIRVDRLQHQHEGTNGADLTLNQPIPKAVLDGRSEQAEGVAYEVIRGPSDRFGWLPVRRTN